jgi:CRP/FNR family transcriptional regulator, cyclic AMP receptor protein
VKPAPPDLLAKAAEHPLLALLDERTRAQVIGAGRLVPYRSKRPVLKEGDPPDKFFVLIDGAVRVFHRSTDGTEVMVKLFRAPAIFGEMEVLVGSPFLEHVATIEPSKILHLPAAWLPRLISEPRFAKALLTDVCARLCIATINERALAFLDVETRLANLLLDYADISGKETGEGLTIEVAMTQESMAKDLAVSRKSLVRGLDKLREDRVLDKRNARYVILDLESLRKKSSRVLGLTYKLK